MTVKYFHELTEDEYYDLMDAGVTWGEVQKIHPQPEWCQYPNALDGPMGCWSLMDQLVKREAFCEKCDCCKAGG